MTFRLYIDPADTMIFRDGRPFNQDDAGRAAAASLFPPPPVALYGAARVAIARALGWTGQGDWSADQTIRSALGSWRDPGALKIAGPYFEIRREHADQRGVPLLPIPATVFASVDTKKDKEAQKDWFEHIQGIRVLTLAKMPIATDLGEVRLLDPGDQRDGCKDEPLGGRWAPREVIEKLLAGVRPEARDLGGPECDDWRTLPKQRLPGWGAGDLGAEEPRVGIQRDIGSRLVEEGMLYVSTRRRLRPGVRLYVEVEAELPKEARERLAFAPLGGESRFAFLEASQGAGAQPAGAAAPSPLTRSKTYLVYFTTPVVMKPPEPSKPIEAKAGQTQPPGMLVSAAFTGPYAQPGLANPGPDNISASETVLPAGTVLFVRNDQEAEVPASGELGEATHMGYGRYLTGVWNDG